VQFYQMTPIGDFMMLIFNENPVSEDKLYFYKVEKLPEKAYRLWEVVQDKYRHPDALEDAVVPVYETRCVGTYTSNHSEFELLQMLYLNEQAARRLVKPTVDQGV